MARLRELPGPNASECEIMPQVQRRDPHEFSGVAAATQHEKRHRTRNHSHRRGALDRSGHFYEPVARVERHPDYLGSDGRRLAGAALSGRVKTKASSARDIMNNWEWNAETKSVGKFFLDAPVTDFLPLLSRLERYPEEDFDTYHIEGTEGAKIFAKEDIVVSIQCGYGTPFIVRGVDLIGKSKEEAQEILQLEFLEMSDKQYINQERTLKIITSKSGKILWVVVNSSNRR